MNRTNATVGGGAKGTSNIVRARFGPGMLLQHDDLELLNAYPRELSRLLFRSLFGCGVICGLKVGTDTNGRKVTVTVEAGLALECSGDPIHVPRGQSFGLDEGCDPDLTSPLWVVLCGTVKRCAPRTAVCPSDEDDTPPVWTRERDDYEIRVLRNAPECACGCLGPLAEGSPVREDDEPRDVEAKCKCVDADLPCYKDHYDGKCGCPCEECSGGDCRCVVLARLDRKGDTDEWTVDHRVRRFIRPVLMRDPVVEAEEKARRPRSEAAAVTEAHALAAVAPAQPVSVQTTSPAGEAAPRKPASGGTKGSSGKRR